MKTPISRRTTLRAAAITSLGVTAAGAIGTNPATTTPASAATSSSPRRRKRLTVDFRSTDALARFTRRQSLIDLGGLPLAHRAGFSPQGIWPESAIESAEHLLHTAPAFVEIDLRYTKDREIVSVHDETLDRETTGTGKISQLDYATIRRLNLVDYVGNVTDYRVRTFDEWLQWSRGTAVLWLDVKDVDPPTVVRKIREHRAEARVIVSAYTFDNLTQFTRLAPDLVYFVPCNAPSTPTVDSILRSGLRPEHIIGGAGYYVPDLDISTQWRGLDVTAMLELSRADNRLRPDQLDAMLYQNSVARGFPLFCTEQYAAVAQILGLTDWPREFWGR